MSMLTKLWKKFIAAFRERVPGWLLEIAYSAVKTIEVASRTDDIKGETKRAQAINLMKEMVADMKEQASDKIINLALEMAVNALGFVEKEVKPEAPAAIEKTSTP